MEPLKADLHIHTSEDPRDLIRYSALELIDMAHEAGFKVLSITNHDTCTYSHYLRDYAKERGIILLPGMEATIEGKHVLLINFPFREMTVSTFKDIYRYKSENSLIIAPHPFYPSPVALGRKFLKHFSLFDAAEWSHFFSKRINFNLKMERIAKRRGLPIVGTSDAHQRVQFNNTYSIVFSYPEKEAVIQSIKNGMVKVKTRPLKFSTLLEINFKMFFRNQLIKRFDSFWLPKDAKVGLK